MGGATGQLEIPRGAVKICGLRRAEDARAAALAGADLIGFIFAPGRRRVAPEEAATAIAAARQATQGTLIAVGVFVDAPADEVNAVSRIAGLDLVQLHGSEPPALVAALERPVLKVLRPVSGAAVATVMAQMDVYAGQRNAPVAFLIDGFAHGAAGGHGIRADWALAALLVERQRVLLAGGLAPDNVEEAIAQVCPWGVDVSSGVERDGNKDRELIGSFVATARRAFGRGQSSSRGFLVS